MLMTDSIFADHPSGRLHVSLANETPEEERARQLAFDTWLAAQPVRSSQQYAMTDYAKVGRSLTW